MIEAVVRLEWLLRARRDQFRPLLSCYFVCLMLDCCVLYYGVIGDIFNAFNFTNFGCLSFFRAPDTNPATLGTPGCVVSLGRREQIGLKVNF